MEPKTWLQKSELKTGSCYVGRCRNAYVAQWMGDRFIHLRTKFGQTFAEEICHPDDEKNYDVFYPIKEIERP